MSHFIANLLQYNKEENKFYLRGGSNNVIPRPNNYQSYEKNEYLLIDLISECLVLNCKNNLSLKVKEAFKTIKENWSKKYEQKNIDFGGTLSINPYSLYRISLYYTSNKEEVIKQKFDISGIREEYIDIQLKEAETMRDFWEEGKEFFETQLEIFFNLIDLPQAMQNTQSKSIEKNNTKEETKKVESKKVEPAIAPKVATKKYFQKEYFKDFINKSKKFNSSNITILNNFCFVDNKVICSDVENYLILNINHDFNFCVNSKLFIQILKTTQTFSIEQGDDFIILEANGISYKLKTESVKDYPIAPAVKEASNKYLLQSFLFKDLIQFTGNDVLNRKAMTGLYIGSNDLCVTNAQQLKVVHHNLNIEDCNLIINKTALSLIIGSDIYFRFDKNYSEFVMGSLTLISRNIDAIYPDYPSVIPTYKIEPPKVKLPITSELLQAIKQSSITANKVTNFVKLEILKDKVIVQSNDLDFGLSSYSEVKQDNIMNIFDSFIVGFDYKQFLECFNIGDIILMETPGRIMIHSDTLITKGMCPLMLN